MVKNADTVTQAIVDLIDDNKTTLEIQRVYYGDTRHIPDFPAVIVYGADKEREIKATQHYHITFSVSIIVLHCIVGSVADIEKVCIQRSEAIEDLLHLPANRTVGGVTFGYIQKVSHSPMGLDKTILRASTMDWFGKGREAFT